MLKTHAHTEETRERLRLWWTPARRRRKSRQVRTYWRLHPERLASRGPRPPAFSSMMSAVMRLRWADPAHRAAMAKALQGPKSAETRRRMSEAAKARWARKRAGQPSDIAPGGPDAPEPLEERAMASSAGGPGME